MGSLVRESGGLVFSQSQSLDVNRGFKVKRMDDIIAREQD